MNYLKIKITDTNPEVEGYYAEGAANHATDSGFDIYMPKNQTVLPTKMIKGSAAQLVKLGIAAAMYDEEGDPVPYWLIPRSSISKTPLRLANSVGLIDADYRGELMAPLDNRTQTSFEIEEFTRLFQIVAFDGKPIEYEIVDELDETARGSGGFGSTGK